MSLRLPVLLLLVSLGTACGTDDPCERYAFRLDPLPAASSRHVACTDVCGNGLSPPTAGPHCAQTLSCRTYDTPQSPCAWVHNLEHGHLVLLYECPEGCPEVVAALEQLAAQARPGLNGIPRAVVAPATGLPARTTALLWRRAHAMQTPDPEALRCFLQLQDEPEVVPEPGLGCF